MRYVSDTICIVMGIAVNCVCPYPTPCTRVSRRYARADLSFLSSVSFVDFPCIKQHAASFGKTRLRSMSQTKQLQYIRQPMRDCSAHESRTPETLAFVRISSIVVAIDGPMRGCSCRKCTQRLLSSANCIAATHAACIANTKRPEELIMDAARKRNTQV